MRPTTAFLLWLSLLTPVGGVLAQESAGEAKPATNDAAVVAAAEEPSSDARVLVAPGFGLNADALRARAALVEAETGLEEALRTEVVRRYRLAVDHLAAAAALEKHAAENERLVLEAPAALERARAELEKPVTDQPLEIAGAATLEDIQRLLSQASADLDAAIKREAEIGEEQQERGERRAGIPRQISELNQRAGTLDSDLVAGGEPAPDDEAALSRRAELLAELVRIDVEGRAAQAELRSIDARRELLPASKELAARRTAAIQRRRDALQELVNSRRRLEAEAAARQAVDKKEELSRSHPRLAELAAETAELAALRTGEQGLAGRIERTKQELTDVESRLASLSAQASTTREKARAAGFNEAIGLLLVKQRTSLPELDRHVKNLRQRTDQIADVQLAALELEERRDRLIDRAAQQREILEAIAVDQGEDAAAEFEPKVAELLTTQRGYLDAAIRDSDSLLVTLIDLDVSERALIDETRAYRDFIDENVLWIRGRSALSLSMLEDALTGLNWLISPTNVASLATAVEHTISDEPFAALVLVMGWLGLLVVARNLKRSVGEYAEAARQNTERAIQASFLLLIATVVMSMPWPALLHLSAWLLGGTGGARLDYTSAVVFGLREVATTYFFFEFGRQLCRREGLGEVYLRWPRDRWLKRVRRSFPPALLIALPALFVTAALNEHGTQKWVDSLGRLAMVQALLVLAGLTWTLLRPEREESPPASAKNQARSLRRYQQPAATAVWVTLAIMALSGWEYAALRFAELIMSTIWTALTLLLIDSVAVRWLLLARRRLAIAQARQRHEARARTEAKGSSEAGADIDASLAQEHVLDLGAVNEQTRRLTRSVLTLVFVLSVWVIWRDVLPALRIFDRVELWSTVQDDGTAVAITLSNLFRALLVLIMTTIATRNMPGFLEITVLQRLPLEASIRYAVTAVARYTIAVIGIVLGFGALGIGWSQVQWLAAAVTVGLGFGLQEIFANFVSGLIILFERPVRVGDTVTLGELKGTVSRIRMRATTIMDWDRRELIVPNKEFITGQLINWSLSDPITRLVIPVGIAYGSDTRKAEEVLYRCAAECQYVLKDPATTVVYREFGDSALLFHVRVFIASMEFYWMTQNAMHYAIDDAFRESGIEIAFPQRDLHVRSVSLPLPVQVSGDDTEKSG